MDKKHNIRNISVIAHVDHGEQREKGASTAPWWGRRRAASIPWQGENAAAVGAIARAPRRQVDAHGLAGGRRRHYGRRAGGPPLF